MQHSVNRASRALSNSACSTVPAGAVQGHWKSRQCRSNGTACRVLYSLSAVILSLYHQIFEDTHSHVRFLLGADEFQSVLCIMHW